METASSQDVHSQALAAILAPIRDLNENWKVDLSAHLETYLRELGDTQGGIQSVNFVEAALLIQRSAGIYGKKVEYLWQLLMKVLESFRKKGLPEGKGNDKRKKCAESVLELLQDFVDIPVTIEKKKWKGKLCAIKLDPPYYSELEYNCPRVKKLSLVDHRSEPLGDKADFRLNSLISNRFVLEEELSYLEDDLLSMSFELACSIHETSINDSIGNKSILGANIDNDSDDGSDRDEPPPMTVEEESEHTLNRECQVGHQAENTELIATVRDTLTSLDAWNASKTSTTEKAVKLQDCCKMPCDIKTEKKRLSKDGSQTEYMDVSLLITEKFHSFAKKLEEYPKFRVELVKESKSRKKKVKESISTEEIEEFRKVLSTDFSGDFLGFEDFEPCSEDEEGFRGYDVPPPGDVQDDDDDDDGGGGAPFDDANPVPDSGSAGAENSEDILIPVTNENDDWGKTYRDMVQERLAKAKLGQEDALAEMTVRVSQWHDSIRPKLEDAEKRGSMDVHAYGTEILNAFPRGTGKYTISFEKLVEDKEEMEVCRYFLASLMLANTYNVEITKSSEEELAVDCMELTLLKSVRHHETLEDYQAPSQAGPSHRN